MYLFVVLRVAWSIECIYHVIENYYCKFALSSPEKLFFV